MITALAWVPRGAARERPVRFELSEEEYSRIQNLAAIEQQGQDEAEEVRRRVLDSDSDSGDDAASNAEEREEGAPLPDVYKMDDYDKEDADAGTSGRRRGLATGGAFGKESQDADMDSDDNVALMEGHGGVALAMDADSEDEDADDDQIGPTDSLLVVALTEDEHSHLEVQLLGEDGNIYTHHDVALPEFPLCLAWTDCPPYREGETEGGASGATAYLSSSAKAEQEAASSVNGDVGQRSVGNYIAVGTFQAGIEIWNLDVLDPIEPAAVLGGTMQDEELEAYERAQAQAKGKDKGKGKGKGKAGKTNKKQRPHVEDSDDEEEEAVYRDGSHTDAVMSLSWNREYRQMLASGSADGTVKVWDMTTRSCSHTFEHHGDKVQCVLWHPTEAFMLATAAFDGQVCLVDCRSAAVTVVNGDKGAKLPCDVESMAWDPFAAHLLYVSMEDGQVSVFDVRSLGSALCTFQAHAKTVTALSFSAKVRGFLATSSVDKSVRVWDVAALHEATAAGPAPKLKKEKASKSKGKAAAAAAASATVIQPKIIANKKLNAGKLFAMQCYDDSGFVMAAGGDKGSVAVWLSDEWDAIRTHFADRKGAIEGEDAAAADVLTAQPGKGVSERDAAVSSGTREPIFAMHGSDSDDSGSEDERQGQSGSDSESDLEEDSEMQADSDDYEDEDESWMDAPEPAPAPAPVKKTAKGKKAKGKR